MGSKICLLTLAILCFVFFEVQPQGILDTYAKCRHRKNPYPLAECLQELVKDIVKGFKKGIPELDMPVMDPLIIKDFTMNCDKLGGGVMDVKTYISNFNGKGMGDMSVDKVQLTSEPGVIEIKMHLETFTGTGNYKVSGQIMGMVMDGNNTFYVIHTNENITYTIKLKFDSNKGYTQITNSSFIQTIQNGRLRLNNLVNQGEYLGDTINAVINANFVFLTNLAQPVMGPIFGGFIDPAFNAVFKHLDKDLGAELSQAVLQ